MRARSVLHLACAVVSVIAAGVACSTTTAGSGREQTPAGASSPDFPTAPSSSSSSTAVVSSSASTTPAQTASTAPPSRTQLTTRLATLTPGQRLVLVAVPGGYEAISYDQKTHLEFWKYAGADWSRVGART